MSIDIEASLEATSRQYAEGCVKTWEDLARYDYVIGVVEPRTIVELGTFSGKSALWFAKRACAPHVITVDCDPHVDPDVEDALSHCNVTRITGSTLDEGVIAEVHGLSSGQVLLSLDSDHSGDHVFAEMEAYADLVQPGSYMVVEDTLLRHMPDEERRHYRGDPLDAVLAWMVQHSGWVIDEDVEAMHPVSQFPSGWLRRL